MLAIFNAGWVDTYRGCSEGGDAGKYTLQVFLLVALVVGFLVALNMFVAVLLESFAIPVDEWEEELDTQDEGDDDDDDDDDDCSTEGGNSNLEQQQRPLCNRCFRYFGVREEGAHVREKCLSIVTHELWEPLILTAIVISTICLLFDTPRNEFPIVKGACDQLNLMLIALFTLETVLKLLAYDFAEHPHGYFLSAWNWLDFVIVIVSLVSLLPDLSTLSSLKLLRVLRPLRLLSRISGMRVIFDFFYESMADILTVLSICLFFQTMFAVLSLNIFLGTLGSCTDPSITIKELCVLPPPPFTPPPPPFAPPPPPPLAPPPMARDLYCSIYMRLDPTCPQPAPPPLPPTQPMQPMLSARVPSPWAHDHFPSDCRDDPEYVDNGWGCEYWVGVPCRLGFGPVQTPDRIERLVVACPAACADIPPCPPSLPPSIPPLAPPDLLSSLKAGFLGRRALKGSSSFTASGATYDQQVAPQWLNPRVGSFDNIFSASLLLFITATGDAWEDVMFLVMDTVEPGVAPMRNDSSIKALFNIAWLIVGSFMAINLFVGMTVDNFLQLRATGEEYTATMTKEQIQWVRTMRASYAHPVHKAPPMPSGSGPLIWLRLKMCLLVTSSKFDVAIMGVIAANTLLMTLHFHGIETYPRYFGLFTSALTVFNRIYYLECLCKIFGLGFGGYFDEPWNQFDFTLVMVSLADEYADELVAFLPIPPMLLRTLRLLRILRSVRLLKHFKDMRNLLMTLLFSFPSFVNIGGLIMLLTLIYAVLGVQLFTYVKPGDAITDEGANFKSVPNAVLLMLQTLTLDNWSMLMSDAMVTPEYGCDPDAVPSDCGSVAAIPFFVSYVIFGAFVLMNLIVAVMLDSFADLTAIDPELASKLDIGDFNDAWTSIDIGNKGELEFNEIASVVLRMAPPLGFEGTTDHDGARAFLASLALRDGPLRYRTVLNALIAHSFHTKDHEIPKELAVVVLHTLESTASGDIDSDAFAEVLVNPSQPSALDGDGQEPSQACRTEEEMSEVETVNSNRSYQRFDATEGGVAAVQEADERGSDQGH